MNNWVPNNVDIELINKLADFLPCRMFDAHAHIYKQSHYDLPVGDYLKQQPDEA